MRATFSWSAASQNFDCNGTFEMPLIRSLQHVYSTHNASSAMLLVRNHGSCHSRRVRKKSPELGGVEPSENGGPRSGAVRYRTRKPLFTTGRYLAQCCNWPLHRPLLFFESAHIAEQNGLVSTAMTRSSCNRDRTEEERQKGTSWAPRRAIHSSQGAKAGESAHARPPVLSPGA